MHTKDQLADALARLGLMVMAEQARAGYYHDFLSPLDLPEMQLVDDLAAAVRDHLEVDPGRAEAILDLRAAVINGEYDASTEESEEWAASQEGQDTFRRLVDK